MLGPRERGTFFDPLLGVLAAIAAAVGAAMLATARGDSYGRRMEKAEREGRSRASGRGHGRELRRSIAPRQILALSPRARIPKPRPRSALAQASASHQKPVLGCPSCRHDARRHRPLRACCHRADSKRSISRQGGRPRHPGHARHLRRHRLRESRHPRVQASISRRRTPGRDTRSFSPPATPSCCGASPAGESQGLSPRAVPTASSSKPTRTSSPSLPSPASWPPGGRELTGPDPAASDRRQTTRRKRLGRDSACVLCGARHPDVLIQERHHVGSSRTSRRWK